MSTLTKRTLAEQITDVSEETEELLLQKRVQEYKKNTIAKRHLEAAVYYLRRAAKEVEENGVIE